MTDQENTQMFDASGYDAITPTEAIVDSENNVTVVEPSAPVTPFDVIKATAEHIGQEVDDPNPSCKLCYGRGYTGRDLLNGGAPIPCKCVQPNFNNDASNQFYNRTRKYSRKERRRMDKDMKKRVKRGQI